MKKIKVVVALGGNAIQSKGEKGTHEESYANVFKTMEAIVPLIKNPKYEVVITHGNGPQVGSMLIQNAAGSTQVPAMPMFVCGAMSQGQIGFWIQQSLYNLLGSKAKIATVVTQVEVDENSKAFKNPSKPVGPFYTKEQADEMKKGTDFVFKEDAGRGWRRVVPSPMPVSIIEIEIVKKMIANGVTVITSGGGGIPVIKVGKIYSGVDAVIDKDRAGALLGELIDADLFIILTAVDKVSLNYGKPNQNNLNKATVKELNKYLTEDHFAEGSMKPKVEAVIDFIKGRKGRKAIITSQQKLAATLKGKDGTTITF
jgi:carbamate kinase